MSADRVAELEQEVADLRARVVEAELRAERAMKTFLFEMRFDQAVREAKVSEDERAQWREAYEADPKSVDDLLSVNWHQAVTA